MDHLLVRYGPAAGNGEYEFTGYALHDVPAELGLAGGGDMVNLYAVAASLWRDLTGRGYGHMLIGTHSGFVYGQAAGGCGSDVSDVPVVPGNYTPLMSVVRVPRPAGAGPGEPETLDLAADYRGTTGPGDLSIRPVVFDVGAPGAPPQQPDPAEVAPAAAKNGGAAGGA